MYKRPQYRAVVARLREPRRFIQVLTGPRQTGKTTLAQQAINAPGIIAHYATADEPALKDLAWVEQQWETARALLPRANVRKSLLLVLDEVQKITGWSETVKRLWDEDSAKSLDLRVMILGSSALLLQKGLAESLAGRFEVVPVTHWSFAEMRAAFGWNVEQYIFYGGYPGAAALISDGERWQQYIGSSLIETTISRDILLMRRVDKPALLRRLFELGCTYSGQVLSYQKMLGQLQDAGNTTTLAHYLSLLDSAGLVTGLSKYSGQTVRQRASSPKLLVMNTGLMTASHGLSFNEARGDPSHWGRLVESAVGATIANGLLGSRGRLFYWAAGDKDVDFVLARGKNLVAVEVKSGSAKKTTAGLSLFAKRYRPAKSVLVGGDGIPVGDFLLTPPLKWIE